jgi:Uma2 family endonuclease
VNILHRPDPAQVEPAQRFRVSGVDWQSYEQILEALGEHHVRITYDRGELELMSPLMPHELYKKWFGDFFVLLALELRIPLRGCGSATFRKQEAGRGLEPDECFYLANARRVRDWRVIDLAHDPPPDLAIEVEVSRSALDRMEVYAALGVPEVWRFDGETLRAYRLGPGPSYQACSASPGLPFLPLAELVPLIQQSLTAEDELQLLQPIQDWLRRRVLPLYQSATGSAPPPGAP